MKHRRTIAILLRQRSESELVGAPNRSNGLSDKYHHERKSRHEDGAGREDQEENARRLLARHNDLEQTLANERKRAAAAERKVETQLSTFSIALDRAQSFQQSERLNYSSNQKTITDLQATVTQLRSELADVRQQQHTEQRTKVHHETLRAGLGTVQQLEAESPRDHRIRAETIDAWVADNKVQPAQVTTINEDEQAQDEQVTLSSDSMVSEAHLWSLSPSGADVLGGVRSLVRSLSEPYPFDEERPPPTPSAKDVELNLELLRKEVDAEAATAATAAAAEEEEEEAALVSE